MRLGIKLNNLLLSIALKEFVRSFLPSQVSIIEFSSETPLEEVDLLLLDYKTLLSFPRPPEAKVLLLDTGLSSSEKRTAFLLYNVDGILQMDASPHLLLEAIEKLQGGGLWVDQNTLREMVHSTEGHELFAPLTPREKEVLSLICKGHSNKEIAKELSISLSTVKNTLRSLYRKLSVSSRSSLQALFIEGKFKTPP